MSCFIFLHWTSSIPGQQERVLELGKSSSRCRELEQTLSSVKAEKARLQHRLDDYIAAEKSSNTSRISLESEVKVLKQAQAQLDQEKTANQALNHAISTLKTQLEQANSARELAEVNKDLGSPWLWLLLNAISLPGTTC